MDTLVHDPRGVHVDRLDLLRIAVVALAVVASWAKMWTPSARIDVVALVAAIVGGWPIFREAFANVLARRMTMELSMTIALAAALVIGEAFTALVIVLFVLIAEVLEHLTVDRGRRAIRDLLDLLPRTVLVRVGDDVRETSIGSLRPGDVVIVKPGGRIPVDGVVVTGHSFVDQASITGEAFPAEKDVGATVFAGTVNLQGTLDVHTNVAGRDTAFARIVQAVELAEKTRAPVQKTADRLAGYLVYVALGAALLTFIVTRDARATISVVIVAGACGVAAGTPLAILGAIGRAARHGAIVKGGIHLEALGEIDTVVLDKTGTLTAGRPQVVAVHPAPGVLERDLVSLAASAEAASEHPLAGAVLARAASMAMHPQAATSFQSTPGRGVTCEVDGERVVVGSRALLEGSGVRVITGAEAAAANVFVARAGLYVGALEVADPVRPEAAEAMAALGAMGLRTLLLTGDAQAMATRVAGEVGIAEAYGDLLPDEKSVRISALQESGRRVAMVGDGVNDAPALARARVGVAMGSGTDVARESADVVLLGNDLLKLVEAIRIARRCRAIIRQNFVGTLAVDAVGMLLAAIGVLGPLLAAIVHVSSELVFILNSTRLLPAARVAAAGRRRAGG